MRRFSLSFRLSLFWIFTVIVAVSLGFLFQSVYRQGAGSQIHSASQTTQAACREIRRKYIWAIENHTFDSKSEVQFQNAILEMILDRYEGVEAGFWSEQNKFTGYAYPTYEGSGIKRDVPDAEKPAIAKLSSRVLSNLASETELSRGQREATLTTACPIEAANEKLALWTMTRISIGAGVAYDRFIWGLGLLFAFVVASGAGSTILLYRFTKNLKSLETAIQNHDLELLPELAFTREKELDSIVNAFNSLAKRTRDARGNAETLTKKLAQADRLSTLGKMAAGIAHEIRNPLATIRLKLENSLVQPAERIPQAAPIIFDQLSRMDRLIQMLLSMTQSFELKPQRIEIASWWENSFVAQKKAAHDKQIQLVFETSVNDWSFDPFHMARAVENLLSNAIAFTPEDGEIRVSISKTEADEKLSIDISDSGPGIDPSIRKQLFEPFASARPGGTGLGLLLVREIAEAHGGSVAALPPPRKSHLSGANFRMEIPWLKS